MQTLKLGLSGSEVTLPTESRINEQGAPTLFTNDSRSAGKALHTDFIATKENWSISYDNISQSDYNTLYSIIQLQLTTPTFLSFMYDDEDGTFTTKTVKAMITRKGALIQRDKFFYRGFSISIEEV